MELKSIISDLERIAPPIYADADDKIGLQVGSQQTEVTRIAVAVDPVPGVIDRAIESGAELIVTHHPLIFHPLYSMAAGEPVPDTIIKLINASAALYVMHTNYDAVPGGVNDILAETLGVNVTDVFAGCRRERLLKIAVFVPENEVERVWSAMAAEGAGFIGKYSHCSFRVNGQGTFLPLPSSNPHIGHVGRLEEVSEVRIETVIPEWQLQDVIDAMVKSHPYEEVAYDVYPLENKPRMHGFGRIGELAEPMTLGDFRSVVEDKLGAKGIRMVGDTTKQVKRVAVASGIGRKFIQEAKARDVDVYLSGEIGYHIMLDAEARGVAAIEAGHYETERPAMVQLADVLQKLYATQPVEIEFVG